MRVVLVFAGILGAGLCLSIPRDRAHSGTSDPCALSPCAKNAICKTSPNGLAFCNCQSGFTGNAFESCQELEPGNSAVLGAAVAGSGSPIPQISETTPTHAGQSGHTSSNPSQSSLKVIYDLEGTQKTPGMFTVEYQPSSDVDISRIPILGSSPTTQLTTQPMDHRPNVPPVQSPVILHETVIHTPQIQRRPSSNHENKHSSSPQHSAVADPMGQYSNCVTVKGVIVCADNSADNPTSGSRRMESEVSHSTGHTLLPQLPTRHQNHHNFNNLNQVSHQSPTEVNGNCNAMCGINSVCRMIKHTPVCGCPADHTGDPGVRCDPIGKQEEKSGCQKHTECAPTQVCADSKCLDPCKDVAQVGVGRDPVVGGENTSLICGTNANCMVIHHTPLCGCVEGYYGNPYVGCVA